MKRTFIMFIALLVMAGGVYAESVWNDADEASPLLIRYKDADNVGTITVTSDNVTITDDGNANTHALGETVAELYSAIVAATNESGEKNFEAVYFAGISGDTCATNYLIAAAATTINKEWSRVLLWDTSYCLHYDVIAGTPGPYAPISGYSIMEIYGSPTGTGNVTIEVYEVKQSLQAGNRLFLKVCTSPVYVYGVGYATNVADNTINAMIVLDEGVYIGNDAYGFVRMTRTAATTGGVGFGYDRN